MCLMSIQLGRISLAKSIFSMKKMKKTTKSLNVSQTPRHNQKLNIFFLIIIKKSSIGSSNTWRYFQVFEVIPCIKYTVFL